MIRPHLLTALTFALAVGTAVNVNAAGNPTYSVRTKIALGGAGGWDYLAFDEASRHLFVTRGDHVEVVDVDAARSIGHIDGTDGVHGVALVPALRRGFASDGKANAVTVFDMDTFKTLATVALTGQKPDAILFDAASGHVLAFNGKSNNVSVIDPAKATQIGTIDLPGRPEFAASDNAGHVFVNLEDSGRLARIDTRSGHVDGNYALPSCESPSGLAIDATHHRLFSVCDKGVMAVTDGKDGRHVATVAIGEGPDAAGFDPATGMVFSSNGQSGTLTVIHQDDADHYRVVQNLATQRSARTLAVDHAHGSVFLSAAQVKDAPDGGRPIADPGSFVVLVVAPH
jgi:DNA-binding beta-propeller fold protein YncE